MKDKLFKKPKKDIKPFAFDEEVANVFDDMINRSVPHYRLLIESVIKIFQQIELPEGNIYDLGSSTGVLLIALSRVFSDESRDLIGIDNSGPMINKAKSKANQLKYSHKISFKEADLENFEYEPASAFIANFTLQFIAPEKRLPLIKKIYDGLNPGGIFILCEKIIFNPGDLSNLTTHIYYDYKRSHGYSDLEIAQKREALEDVLIPDTMEVNLHRMHEAGFKKITPFFQWFNFAGYLGIK